jgi:acetyl-CoA synthetase
MTPQPAGFAWHPSEAVKQEANWTAFLKFVGMSDYAAMECRAANDPAWFWESVMRFLDLQWSTPYHAVLDLGRGKPWPRWCLGGRTNLAATCLDRNTTQDKLAIVWEGEDGEIRRWTYSDLRAQTGRLANGLTSIGISAGDRVGIYMPLLPEAAAAFLAIAKIGAIALPLFSGFGPDAIATRLNDAEAKALITVDGMHRRGQKVDLKVAVDLAARSIPSLEHIVVLRRFGGSAMEAGRDIYWDELVRDQSPDAESAALDAETPLMIVYTSGTTGRPKGTVHSHVGFLVKTGLDFVLGFDLKRSDTLLWPTDMGWLVGPIQMTAATLAGATLVLMEGAPDFPQPDRLFRLAASEKVSFLGLGPTVARLMKRYGADAVKKHDLSAVRVVASTGEPWDLDSWSWVFDNVCEHRAPLMNYSGGTEVGGILSTNILFPIKPGGFYGPLPGTGADIVDSDGRSVPADTVGELVMRTPTMGMTQGLWRDPDRYIQSYWSRFPDIWVHGDWVSRDADGTWFVHGRSDDTIKLAGKRTGPAEIESALMSTRLVEEAAAVGIPDPLKGEAVVVAVVLLPAARNQSDAPSQLSKAIVDALGAPFKPKHVIVIGNLPKTRNSKIMRRVVRAVLVGDDPGDLSSLINPEAVEELKLAADNLNISRGRAR